MKPTAHNPLNKTPRATGHTIRNLLFLPPPHNYGYPVPDQGINHHVKNGGGETVYLGNLARALERGAIIFPHQCHHQEVVPININNPLRPQ